MSAADDYRALKSVMDLASEYFAKALFGEIGSGSPTASVVFPTPQHVIVDSGTVSAVDVSDRSGRLLGHVTIDNTSITVALDAASLAALETINAIVSGTVSVGNFPATQPVSGTVTANVADNRSLVERMGVRAPASGYHLWLDVTSSNPLYIYVCEAPDGAVATDSTFRGIRITLDALGNPLGAVQTASGFVWNNRASASWAA